MSRPAPARVRLPLLAPLTVLLVLLAAGAGAGPVRAAGPVTPPPPTLSVRAAALYAPATGQTLDAVAPDRELAIASTTKLMTALVVLEHVHDLSRTFVFPDYATAASDSQIGLRPGERMTVHDLLVAMMLPSADDAAEDLAENVGHGSIARFVAMMNAQARRLRLTHTHYTTPIGLDTPGNHSSASDLVRLADYDLTHEPEFARIVRMRRASLATGPAREVDNLNGLLVHPWVDGVKTGHTSEAGYVLVASGRRDGMRLISAVLGTDSEAARDANSLALLDYGFAAFRLRRPLRRGQVVAHPTVADRPGLRVPVHVARGYVRVLARGEPVRVRVAVPGRLVGPLPAGAVVGSATVLGSGRRLTRVPVVLGRRLPAVSRLAVVGRTVDRAWVLALVAALAALGLAGILARAGTLRLGAGVGGAPRSGGRRGGGPRPR